MSGTAFSIVLFKPVQQYGEISVMISSRDNDHNSLREDIRKRPEQHEFVADFIVGENQIPEESRDMFKALLSLDSAMEDADGSFSTLLEDVITAYLRGHIDASDVKDLNIEGDISELESALFQTLVLLERAMLLRGMSSGLISDVLVSIIKIIDRTMKNR